MARRKNIATIAQALSDARRVRILDLLAAERREACCSPENPDAPTAMCACDLRPALDDIAASKLAYHLKQLREAGLIDEQPRGRWVYYTLNEIAFEDYANEIAQRWGEGRTARRSAAKSTRRRH